MIRRLSIIAAVSIAAGAAAPAFATAVTGDPSADGWTMTSSSSLAIGTYVRGAGGFDYDVYAKTFKLTAGDPLFFNSNWQTGDTILGLGGVMNTQSNVTFRSVTKFGGTGTTYSASILPSPGGNGNGQSSLGHGGEGGVLVGFNYMRTSGDLNTAAWAGSFITPDTFRYYDASDGAPNEESYDANAGIRDYARIIALFDGTGNSSVDDLVKSWEVVLNISAMMRDSNFDLFPVAGADSILTFQRSTNETEFTDALTRTGTLPADVPEPAGLALLGFALALAGYRLHRRT